MYMSGTLFELVASVRGAEDRQIGGSCGGCRVSVLVPEVMMIVVGLKFIPSFSLLRARFIAAIVSMTSTDWEGMLTTLAGLEAVRGDVRAAAKLQVRRGPRAGREFVDELKIEM